MNNRYYKIGRDNDTKLILRHLGTKLIELNQFIEESSKLLQRIQSGIFSPTFRVKHEKDYIEQISLIEKAKENYKSMLLQHMLLTQIEKNLQKDNRIALEKFYDECNSIINKRNELKAPLLAFNELAGRYAHTMRSASKLARDKSLSSTKVGLRGISFLNSPTGHAFLMSPEGEKVLFTKEGRLTPQGKEFLESDQGKRFKEIPETKELLEQKNQQYLAYVEAIKKQKEEKASAREAARKAHNAELLARMREEKATKNAAAAANDAAINPSATTLSSAQSSQSSASTTVTTTSSTLEMAQSPHAPHLTALDIPSSGEDIIEEFSQTSPTSDMPSRRFRS